MPRHTRPPTSGPAAAAQSRSAAEPFTLLLVDHNAHDAVLLRQAIGPRPIRFLHALDLTAARRTLDQNAIDLLVIADDLPAGSGVELLRTLPPKRRPAQTIVLTGDTRRRAAVDAVRAGAVDVLTRPLRPSEVAERLACAIARHRTCRRDHDRVQRLRRVCKKLNHAREQVAQQVDILCRDLVAAYQELAGQLQQVTQTGEFAGVIRHELDLEQLLRKTLEYILEKAGPTNAAIFLPANADEFSLGGYVNYDWTADSPDMLLQHLADAVTPKVAQLDHALHAADEHALSDLLGDDAPYLEGCHLIAAPCRVDQETLAVLVLFRDAAEPFDDRALEVCDAIGPMLAQYLARIIRVHHRHLPDPAEPEDDSLLPF